MLAGGSPIHDAVNCQLCPVFSAAVFRMRFGIFARRRQLSVLKLNVSSFCPCSSTGTTYSPFSQRSSVPRLSLTREKISDSYSSPARLVREYVDLKIIINDLNGLSATRVRIFCCTPLRKSCL